MVVDRIGPGRYNYIFTLGSFDDIDDIGHSDNSGILIEHVVVCYLEVFTFAEGLVDWVAF